MPIRVSVFAAAALLAGCAGLSHSMQYSDVAHVELSDPSLPHAFWIFDKPAEGRMLVNTALDAAVVQGAARGATLGAIDTSTDHQQFERAAQMFLDRSGRSCKVTKLERILAPTNFEATYSCAEA